MDELNSIENTRSSATMRPMISEEIKAAIAKAGIKQSDLARMTGLSQAHISQLASGAVQPSHAVMKALDETGLMSRKFSVERVRRNGWLDISGLDAYDVEELMTMVQYKRTGEWIVEEGKSNDYRIHP